MDGWSASRTIKWVVRDVYLVVRAQVAHDVPHGPRLGTWYMRAV